MGLDMYLNGTKNDEQIELAYWRKHPDLHGYIVKTFGGGIDECQPIEITNLDQLILAVERRELPHTEGFFFGQSRPEDRMYTLEQLASVKEWLGKNPGAKLIYQASW